MHNVTFRGTSVTKRHELMTRVRHIRDLANAMTGFDEVEIPLQHQFSPGVYAREVTMPAGSLVVGKIHKTRHLNIISKGSCTVVTPLRRLEITAPYTFESYEGEQKAVLMHDEDVVWTTIHVTNETDLVKLEDHCIAEDYTEDLLVGLTEHIGESSWLGLQLQ